MILIRKVNFLQTFINTIITKAREVKRIHLSFEATKYEESVTQIKSEIKRLNEEITKIEKNIGQSM
jgi:peptidoglycan hydrolase CwlO-like protein